MKQVKGTDPSPDPARHVLLRVPELKSQNLSQIRGSGEPALQPHQHPGKKLEAKRGKKGGKTKHFFRAGTKTCPWKVRCWVIPLDLSPQWLRATPLSAVPMLFFWVGCCVPYSLSYLLSKRKVIPTVGGPMTGCSVLRHRSVRGTWPALLYPGPGWCCREPARTFF